MSAENAISADSRTPTKFDELIGPLVRPLTFVLGMQGGGDLPIAEVVELADQVIVVGPAVQIIRVMRTVGEDSRQKIKFAAYDPKTRDIKHERAVDLARTLEKTGGTVVIVGLMGSIEYKRRGQLTIEDGHVQGTGMLTSALRNSPASCRIALGQDLEYFLGQDPARNGYFSLIGTDVGSALASLKQRLS